MPAKRYRTAAAIHSQHIADWRAQSSARSQPGGGLEIVS
jgi:hypothetical protein